MNGSPVRPVPWLLVLLAVVLSAASEVLAASTGVQYSPGNDVFVWAITLAFGVTGALIASRHGRNPIGWLFLVAAVSAGIGNLAGAYAEFYVVERRGPALLGGIAAEYGEQSWMPFILLPATFLLLLFPDGHLLSRRWRPVAWCAGIGLGAGFVLGAMIDGPVPDHPELQNPFGVDSPLIDPLQGLTLLLVAIGIIGSSVSLVLRFRRSHGEQRQQIKWLALSGTVVAVTIVVVFPLYDVVGSGLANALMMTAVTGLPLTAGMAILRYRLYDIDVVINRTLVYGALTALLAGTYLLSVLLLQLALDSLTQGSGLAVAASTLGTATLVRPARSRIQSVVDRRFFRKKYDAARTLAEFGSRLRREVDLDALQADLRSVVSETMQPSSLSLWTPRVLR